MRRRGCRAYGAARIRPPPSRTSAFNPTRRVQHGRAVRLYGYVTTLPAQFQPRRSVLFGDGAQLTAEAQPVDLRPQGQHPLGLELRMAVGDRFADAQLGSAVALLDGPQGRARRRWGDGG
jgi:hypothetical protein